MKRRSKQLKMAVALSLALGAGLAGAQNLTAYNALASNLEQAVTARSASAEAALAKLDAAQTALNELSPTLRNRQIVSGLNEALAGARGALARTPAELQAQVLQARGLMRKALYDQTLTALSSAPGNSADQLRVLTREFGLSSSEAQAVTADNKAGNLERVAWRFQRAAVQKVSAALKAARPERTTASYVNLAQATSWFTVMQDAGSSSGLKVSQFGDALRQLTAGDTAALGQSLTTLRGGVATLSASLASPPAKSGQPAPTTQPNRPSPQPTPQPNTNVPVVTPTPQPTPQPNQQPTPQPGTGAGVQASGAGAVYAALGRALGATSHADNILARAELAKASAALGSLPGTLRAASGFEGLQAHLGAMQGRTGLRPSDVQALIGELANVEQAASGQPSSALNGVSAGVARGLGGWLRVLVFLLLALACAAPLYLVNLAFGGRNTYWRAITAGLVLLLLPVFLEGLFGLLGAIGDLAGLAPLRSLLNFTLTQGAYALPVWAILSAAALGLTAFGFRGLCQQFGLLGASSGSKNTTQHTSFDWDEDV